MSHIARKTCSSLSMSSMTQGKRGWCYLGCLLLLPPLFILRLHQAFLGAQQLFVQNVGLVFSLNANTNKHLWRGAFKSQPNRSSFSNLYRFKHTPPSPGALVCYLVVLTVWLSVRRGWGMFFLCTAACVCLSCRHLQKRLAKWGCVWSTLCFSFCTLYYTHMLAGGDKYTHNKT